MSPQGIRGRGRGVWKRVQSLSSQGQEEGEEASPARAAAGPAGLPPSRASVLRTLTLEQKGGQTSPTNLLPSPLHPQDNEEKQTLGRLAPSHPHHWPEMGPKLPGQEMSETAQRIVQESKRKLWSLATRAQREGVAGGRTMAAALVYKSRLVGYSVVQVAKGLWVCCVAWPPGIAL